MKKNYQLSFKNSAALLVLLFAFAATTFADPNYWNYNATTGNENSFPLNQPAGKLVQWLIRAGEFNQPTPAPANKVIHSVSWRLTSNPTYQLPPGTYTNIRIILYTTTTTDLTTGTFFLTNPDTVYYRASFACPGGNGIWLNFTLDHDYPYDPTKSLIIQLEQGGWSASGGFSICHTNVAGGRRVWSVGGPPFTPYASVGVNVPNFGIELIDAAPVCSYSWATQTSGVTNLFQASWASSGLVGWVGGAAATVRKTTDGGTTWTNANPNPELSQVIFIIYGHLMPIMLY
jgi:hypothetical protein